MVGLICFANDGGLGIQTKRLYDMIKPDRVMLVDSRGFSKNKKMHWDWYPKEITTVVKGFPKNRDIVKWVPGLTSVLTVENPYNFFLIHHCRELGIKTYCQTNYEFCENVFAPWLPVPDMFLMPSYWMIDDMKKRFGKDRVMYLPPPIDKNEFQAEKTRAKLTRFLHVIGTLAHADRNGTLDLLKAVKRTSNDYTLTIHSQHKLPDNYIIKDKRVIYRIKNFKKNADLYKGFDALILPRRYGGLSLTTNEALMSGMPVMMTNISPNNKLLPKKWLVPARKRANIQARASIPCYSAYTHSLALKIDEWALKAPSSMVARIIGEKNFSTEVLKETYKKLLL